MTEDTAPCIGAEIWQRAREQHPRLDRAQDRAALDTTLRKMLIKVRPLGLQSHAAEIVRTLRRREFEALDQPDLLRRVEIIEAWIAEIERCQGFHIPPTRSASTAREITSIGDVDP
jgi:hypothetical protein